MSHIRTQIRKSVITKLRSAGGFGVADARLRILRGIQSDQFPIALVSVADTAVPVGKNPPGKRPLQRQVFVSIQLHEIADVEELDEKLDDLAIKVEEALTDPAALNFGKVLDWTYVGTTAGHEEEAKENGTSSVTVTFRGTVTTQEGQPSINIHP